jgi:hypothetical protein
MPNSKWQIFNELETFAKEKLGKDFFGGLNPANEKIGQYYIEPFTENGVLRIRLMQRINNDKYKTLIDTIYNQQGAEKIKNFINTL